MPAHVASFITYTLGHYDGLIVHCYIHMCEIKARHTLWVFSCQITNK